MKHYQRSDSCHAIIAGSIRRTRKKAKLTQGALADAAGLSRATVAAIEGGRYNSLTLASLERLAQALEVEEADLLVRKSSLDDTAIKKWKASPWFDAVTPNDDEVARVGRLPKDFWKGKPPSPATIADLIRLIRVHDRNEP
jgi:transcriptional regulator with XRE-family HTH domain